MPDSHDHDMYQKAYKDGIRDALLKLDHLMAELSDQGPIVTMTLKLAFDRISQPKEEYVEF